MMPKREYKVSYISSEAIFAVPAMKPSKVILAMLLCFTLMLSDIYFGASSKIRTYAHDVFMPLSALVNLPLNLIRKSGDVFKTRYTLRKELDEFQIENKKLRVTNQFLEKVSKENEELNRLWSSARLNLNNYSLVKKRTISSNEFQPLLIVDISSDSSIDLNDSLITDKGLIGRVIASSKYSAEVMLLHDVRSFVPVISEKSKLHANIKGGGLGRSGKLQYVKKTAAYELGEKVYSSGIADTFPEGVYVGEIVSIKDLSDSEFLEVEISFLQSPLNQDFYFVYENE